MKFKEYIAKNPGLGGPGSWRRWRDKLPPELEARALATYHVLSEHQSDTAEEWVDGFCYDMHPDREISVWECYAAIYRRHATGRSAVERAAVYRILMVHISETEVVNLADTPGVYKVLSSAIAESDATGVHVDIPVLDAKIEALEAAHAANKAKMLVLEHTVFGLGKTYARLWRFLKDDLSGLQNN